ncbi:MAG TPA: SAM-dependent chlorinase/fluorinase, partial [Acidimicrobiia bacterium]
MLIAFASDYGLADEFVGVCKAVMLGLAPDVRILDLSHDIPAHDVRAGSLLLVRAVQYLPDETILVAVVDPGVGTARRLVAVEVAGGMLLGPDNGLLAPAVAMAGGARTVVSLDEPEYRLPAPGPTFAGRDILAAAAGHLAAGVPLSDLGTPLDPGTLVPGLVSLPEVRPDGSIAGEVWWVDRFGNCQLNIDPTELGREGAYPGARLEVHLAGDIRAARVVHTYSDAKPSELVLMVDSYGLLALALDRESAAAALGLRAGSSVTLVPEGAGPAG